MVHRTKEVQSGIFFKFLPWPSCRHWPKVCKPIDKGHADHAPPLVHSASLAMVTTNEAKKSVLEGFRCLVAQASNLGVIVLLLSPLPSHQ